MLVSELLREAALIEAKAPWLKAIDFTIGLLRRLQKMGKKFPIDYNIAIKRLAEMRKVSQSKFRMDTVNENVRKLRDPVAEKVFNEAEQLEARSIPKNADLAAFQKPLPNKAGAAKAEQAKLLISLIAPVLNVDPSEVEDLVIEDQAAFNKAFKAIEPLLKKTKTAVDATMPEQLGVEYKSRVKTPISIFPKQTREERVPFTRFSDLVACRIVTDNLRNMCAAARATQDSFDIVNKKNYYIVENSPYRAINYNFVKNDIVVEFQLKTIQNDIEANISHDLIHAKEKAIVSLSDQEKKLVKGMLAASTQISMREWKELMGLDMVTSKSYKF